MKQKKIFSKEFANYLCKRGCQMIGTEINNQKPWLYVYLFEDTEELQIYMTQFTSHKRGGDRNE